MCTLSQISLAFEGPMPWMYWSATSTRLLVGILTPAIRATGLSMSAKPRLRGLSVPRPVEPGPCGFQKRRCPSPRNESRDTMSAEEADVRALFLYVNPRLAVQSSHPTCVLHSGQNCGERTRTRRTFLREMRSLV